jgi:lysophospholipase L1-like esterase
VLELALRVAGSGPSGDPALTLARFSNQFPLFERNGNVYQILRAREPFFNRQQFQAEKPAAAYRVFVFGGSTVYGHPYTSETAFPKWLAIELSGTSPGRIVEVVNCGGVSYASYRIAPIVREVLAYQPDLIVLAMGHNEFLEDRTYQPLGSRPAWRRWIDRCAGSLRAVAAGRRFLEFLTAQATGRGPSASPPERLSGEVEARLDDALTGYASYRRDPEWHRQVFAQFQEATRTMIADCRAAHVPVLIVTLGSSLRDCPPFKSEHQDGLSAEAEARWQKAFDAAAAAEDRDPGAALAMYREAEAIDDAFALLSFRIARCLDRAGDAVAAREHYLRAKDNDICPLRMLESMYRFQLAVAGETGCLLVNARQLLESLDPDGLPGHDLYLDHVHPTVGGHQRMAAAIAATLHESGLFPVESAWSPEARRAAYREHLRRLPASYFPNGRRRVEWLDNWARRKRLFDETVPRTGRECLRHAIRQLEFGDEEGAWRLFREAMGHDPATAQQVYLHARELWTQGRPHVGQALLARLAGFVNDPAIQSTLNAAAAELAQP